MTGRFLSFLASSLLYLTVAAILVLLALVTLGVVGR